MKFSRLLLLTCAAICSVLPVLAHDRHSGMAYSADSILVKFSPGTPAQKKATARSAVRASLTRSFNSVPGLEKMTVPSGSVEEAIARLARNPNVIYVEPDYVIEPHATTPDDPDLALLWGMQRIDAQNAWDVSTGEATQLIAVIDSGIDYTHEDLAQNIWVNSGEIPGDGIDNDGNGFVDDIHGYDFANDDGDPMDDNSHGTHVAGTICGYGNNGTGISGVVWRCRLMALKFLDQNNRGLYSDAIAAIDYAVGMGAKISNHSWGGDSYSASLLDALAGAESAGHLVIASAGNDARDTDLTPAYPAAYHLDNIIAVANVDTDDSLRYDSNWGVTSVDLGAPGSSVYSTVPGGYAFKWGTSMAAPHVTGAAALFAAVNPTATAAAIKGALLNSVEPLPSLAGKTVSGGILDAVAALSVAPQPSGSLDLRVGSGADDVEESKADGSIYTDSSDLEFGYDSFVSADQLIGLRFTNVHIPAGATIASAILMLVADETNSDPATFAIRAHASDNAPAFGGQDYAVSARALSQAATSWSVAAWDQAGGIHSSPNLAAVVQEVVDRPAWQAGNALALIVDSSGTRTAYAWEGSANLAPRLTISYVTGSGAENEAPIAGFNIDASTGEIPFDASFVDSSSDADGQIVSWHWDFGDGATSSERNPIHRYTQSGSFIAILTVTDDQGATGTTSQVVIATDGNAPPAAPGSLTLEKIFSGKGKSKVLTGLSLSWQDNASNESGYIVERCEEISSGKGRNRVTVCDFSVLATVGADVTRFDASPLSGYRFRVKAFNEAGESAYSNEVGS